VLVWAERLLTAWSIIFYHLLFFDSDVCLLEDLSTKVNNEGSPNYTECLSNGDRNPGVRLC